MPTEYSGGKANLAQGGIWLWLSISDGRVMSMSQDKVSYVEQFPQQYTELRWTIVSYWNDILLYSAQVQAYTKLGYLALDWVITRNGPKLLEINARAWLEIQNVNLVPLERRLSQVEWLKIASPEKWVEIAKALFHPKIQLFQEQHKKILYLEQIWTIVHGREVLIRVSLETMQTTVSEDIIDFLGTSELLQVSIDDIIRIELKDYKTSVDIKNTIILWKRDIGEYLIQPTKKTITSKISESHKWTKEVLLLDDAVYRLSKKINLSSLLKPENYFSEFDAYVREWQWYNPIFSYHFPDASRTAMLLESIEKLKLQASTLYESWQSIWLIYQEKLDEIQDKILLLQAYRDENHANIYEQNIRLFWQTHPSYLYDAKEKILSLHEKSRKEDEKILWKILSLEEVLEKITGYFEKHDMPHIPVVIESSNLSRMSVAYGKEVKIRVSKDAVFHEKEMEATLAHEIGTHLRRYINGKQIWLKVFQYGTGYYLWDEEGFAIHQSLSYLPEGYEKNAMYIKYYLLDKADTLSFSETLDLIRSLYPHKSIESLFADTVRIKRWVIHTATRLVSWTSYQKDKVYLDGYMRIRRWIEEGGYANLLMVGKIKISDLKHLDFSHF